MIDLVRLILLAGDGGHGRVSFRREKYVAKGGPDGGDGGDGGGIIIVGDRGVNTLQHFVGKKKFQAEAGSMGGKKKCHGQKGEDIFLKVPLGTIIWVLEENQSSYNRIGKVGASSILKSSDVRKMKYFVEKPGERVSPPDEDELHMVEFYRNAVKSDHSKLFVHQSKHQDYSVIKPRTIKQSVYQFCKIMENGQEFVVSQGGFGGLGNTAFKGPSNTTPLKAQYGTYGEKKIVIVELKLLADVGLVGFPNAGKSTLLSRLTKAKPKVANYPFTTLEPNLGTIAGQFKGDKKSLVVADLPGLIAGASQGKGLGYRFLRHIENCSQLLFMIFLEEEIVYDETKKNKEKAELLFKQYLELQNELKQFNPDLIKKKSVVALNKIDLYSESLINEIKDFFSKKNIKLSLMSGYSGAGLKEMSKTLLLNLE